MNIDAASAFQSLSYAVWFVESDEKKNLQKSQKKKLKSGGKLQPSSVWEARKFLRFSL
jgi:hypothetical protein